MENQASPPYQAMAPGVTSPMVWPAEKNTEDVQQLQVQPVHRHFNGNDFIERVDVQPAPQRPAQYDPNMFEKGPEPATVTPLRSLNDQPAMIACPYCKHRAMTRVNKQDSSMTTICGVVLCLICICAACLPCMCGWFQDYDHICTNCSNRVATRRQDGGIEVYEPKEDTKTHYPDALSKPAPTHQKG